MVKCPHCFDGAEHVTIVFDKGNNSKDNLAVVDDTPYHFVGSLVPTQHSDLLEVPRKRFQSLAQDGLPEVLVYRTTKKVFGRKRTVVVTYNENLFVAQSKTLLREIGKRQQRFCELVTRLERWRRGEIRSGRPPTVAATQRILKLLGDIREMVMIFPPQARGGKHVPDLIRYQCSGP